MKVGKTTIATKFEKPLLLATEMGYLALPGVMPQPITSWSEFKQVLRQLKQEHAHEMYSNIIIDTVDILYDLCEKYICSQNSVDKIADVPYGGGYSATKREFDEALRSIPMMGYGLVMISHAQDKSFTDENGATFNKIVPTLGNAPRLIVDRMVDVMGYAHSVQNDDGTTKVVLSLRETPRFEAGCRFKYIKSEIDFTYDNLVNAIGEAIDKEANMNDNKYITNEPVSYKQDDDKRSFQELKNDFNDLFGVIKENVSPDALKSEWVPRVGVIVAKYLGKGKKVAEATDDQYEQLELIVDEMKEVVSELKNK